MSLKNMSVRDGESISQDASLLPRDFKGEGAQPVLRIDLNDPERKSIVMSTSEMPSSQEPE